MRTSTTTEPVHLPISAKLITSALIAMMAVITAFVLVIYFTIRMDREARAERLGAPVEISSNP